MSNVTNKEIADAFEKALTLIWNGESERALDLKDEQRRRSRYICMALIRVGRYHPEMALAVEVARKVIMQRLKGAISLEAWLQREVGVSPISEPDFDVKVQAHRIAWVKLLIEEFRSQA